MTRSRAVRGRSQPAIAPATHPRLRHGTRTSRTPTKGEGKCHNMEYCDPCGRCFNSEAALELHLRTPIARDVREPSIHQQPIANMFSILPTTISALIVPTSPDFANSKAFDKHREAAYHCRTPCHRNSKTRHEYLLTTLQGTNSSCASKISGTTTNLEPAVLDVP
jgi:hypothetical protein